MDNKRLRKASAAIAAVLAVCGTAIGTAYAADSTTTVGKSTSTTAAQLSEAETTSSTTEASTEAAAEENGEGDWYKAELDSYDDSLSLISYEVSPESSGKKKKGPTPVELDVTGGYVGDIPWFESEPVIESTPGKFAVVTYGWGHGVGMSQCGADAMAKAGATCEEIINQYYPGTELVQMDAAL